jgi:hypothetical protein
MVALVEWFNFARRFGWTNRFAFISRLAATNRLDFISRLASTNWWDFIKEALQNRDLVAQASREPLRHQGTLGLARFFQSFLNWFGWAEPEGMRVCPPLLMLAKLLLASIPLPPRPLADYSKRSWCQEEMATLFRSKPQARRPWRLMAPESIDSANRLVANRAPSAKSRHSNLDLWIRMPDQWLEK